MAVVAPEKRTRVSRKLAGPASWSRGDTLRTLAWMVAAVAARGPLVARIEGVLDHDQSIVGLMALDIAAWRRFPIFFDGQRYMGALEAYVAAVFVKFFGHSTMVVAFSPLLFFGLFTAGQYVVWRRWSDRTTGHIAALFSVLAAPMLAIWSVVPRGGYVELLAWAILVLGVYRTATRPDRPPLTRLQQAAWGFLLAFGYFLNPLSLIVYVTLAVDWAFGRHGVDVRSERRLDGGWIDSRWAPAAWAGLGGGLITALALCCHVEFRRKELSPFVFVMDVIPGGAGIAVGALGVAGLIGWAVWWSGLARRVWITAPVHPAFMVGALVAMAPFALHNLCVWLGVVPFVKSLPIWIRAPWDIRDNLRDGINALSTVIGSDPHGTASVLIGQGVELPTPVWPHVASGLAWATPLVVAASISLIAIVTWRDRRAWKQFWSLRGHEPTPPTVLVLLGLAVTAALYILQATSPNSSSIRYLVPAWIFLPGLLASGVRAVPKRWRAAAALAVLIPWSVAQLNLWAEINRPSPLRPLATELEHRGVKAILAETPVALMVANLTHGQVGTLEYHTKWPRLGDRYADRFEAGRAITCVVDTQLAWFPGDDSTTPLAEDLGAAIQSLARSRPDRVRRVWQVGRFEAWEVDLPLSEIVPSKKKSLPPGS